MPSSPGSLYGGPAIVTEIDWQREKAVELGDWPTGCQKGGKTVSERLEKKPATEGHGIPFSQRHLMQNDHTEHS